MVYGYADEMKVIGRDLIEAVAQARDLGRETKEEEELRKAEEELFREFGKE